jgi:hypothetical protein
VPLLGPDVVLLALETLAGSAVASSNAVLVVELDGRLDGARVEHALARFLPTCPWLGGRLQRPRPWGKLRWRVPRGGPAMPPVLMTTLGATTLTAFVDGELERRIDPWREPPLRCTVVTDGARSVLVLTWAHALMDPKGSEYLVRLLAALDEGAVDGAGSEPMLVAPPEARPLRERGALASRGAAHLKTLAPVPPLSLASAPAGPDRTARRHRRFRFGATPPPSDRTRRGMPWRLAVVAKAMTALWVARGLPTDVPFLIPVSVDRRPRGAPGPLLGNYLAFHFARAVPPVDGDAAALARALRADLADAVRRDDFEAAWAGLAFARYRPLRGLFRELPWAAHGDFCSFHFADTDVLLAGCPRLFGLPVSGGYHVTSVPERPGVGVFFSRAGDTENLIVSWAGDVLDDGDADTIAAVVQAEMGWEAVP